MIANRTLVMHGGKNSRSHKGQAASKERKILSRFTRPEPSPAQVLEAERCRSMSMSERCALLPKTALSY